MCALPFRSESNITGIRLIWAELFHQHGQPKRTITKIKRKENSLNIIVFLIGRCSPGGATEALAAVLPDAEEEGLGGGHLVRDDAMKFAEIRCGEPRFLRVFDKDKTQGSADGHDGDPQHGHQDKDGDEHQGPHGPRVALGYSLGRDPRRVA